MSHPFSYLSRSALLAAVALAAAGLAVGLLAAPRASSQASLDRPFVHCKTVAAANPPPLTLAAMSCTSEDGMVFDDGGITVPAGYRFYVTDIILTYAAATYMAQYSGNTAVATLQFPGGGPLYQDLIHFNSPYFVLRPGERLYTGVYTVYVTGYLLTNRSFLPDVERN
jgi:hypothetical protein